jgi:flagellar motor switch protein FliN/FliY
MAEPPKEPSPTPSPDGAASDPTDVDALLSDAVDAAAAASVPPVDTEEITQADIDALMIAAGGGEHAPTAATPAAAASTAPAAVTTQRYELPTMLNDVKLRVKIELGRTRMLVEDVLKLGEGGVVELDKLAGDPVDVYANDRLIARGEVLVLTDSFCVRISEVVSRDPHRVSV